MSSTSMAKWWMHGPSPEARASAESSLSYLISARSIVPSVRCREVWSLTWPVSISTKPKPFFVKLRGLFQVIDLQSDMNDARHSPSVATKPALTRLGERIQLYPKRGSGSFRVRKIFTRRKISRFARNDDNLRDLSSRTK